MSEIGTSVKAMVAAVNEQFGKLDYAVNSAGVSRYGNAAQNAADQCRFHDKSKPTLQM